MDKTVALPLKTGGWTTAQGAKILVGSLDLLALIFLVVFGKA